jgi:signal transduction histidine kinase
VLTRLQSSRLLAPTVLISLLLVAVCIGGALYLNHLHVGVSLVLTENVDSALAAKDLQATLTEMMHLLRGDHSNPNRLYEELRARNHQARAQLEVILNHANTEPERDLAISVQQGMQQLEDSWRDRKTTNARELVDFDRQLARLLDEQVLPDCQKLLYYNTNQVGVSDQANQDINDELTWGLVAVGLGAPLSGLLLGYAVARRLHQSIYQLSVRIRDTAGRLSSELKPVTLEETYDLDQVSPQLQAIRVEIEQVFQRLQQREREILHADQLSAVGQVAAGVAHELRNPLTSIKMLVQTGLEGSPPSGLAVEDLSIIEHEIRRMETCIQTFLDFARPPSAERRHTDLLAVVGRALALVEGRARRQKVLCQAELPAEPVELLIDPEQIHQVVVNLLLNSLDAMPQGGSLWVQVEPPTPQTPVATIRIADSGQGIPADILARLFEPFVSSKETGVGLGLSICKRLVEAHGGTIAGSNELGGGAQFTIQLPAEEPAAEPVVSAESDNANAAGR